MVGLFRGCFGKRVVLLLKPRSDFPGSDGTGTIFCRVNA